MIALSDTPTLRTDRFTLRAPVATDWPAWCAFHTSERARFVGGTGETTTAWRSFGHFVGHWVLRGFGSFVIQTHDDPAPLGSVGPWYPEGWPETEIGWTLWSPEAEGKGIIQEAARAGIDFAFGTLGWSQAVSYIEPGNTASIRVAERLGATRDDTAPNPFDDNTLVYRHPVPGARA